jgi:hypothetical protein
MSAADQVDRYAPTRKVKKIDLATVCIFLGILPIEVFTYNMISPRENVKGNRVLGPSP